MKIFNINKICILLPVILFALKSTAQLSPYDNAVYFNKMSINFLEPKPKIESSTVYYSDKWLYGNLYLHDSMMIENCKIKYELIENIFEIKTAEEIKILPANKVKQFYWISNSSDTTFFISKSTLGFKNDSSLVEILVYGNLSFLRNYELKKLHNENKTYGVNNSDMQYIKTEILYFYENNSLSKIDNSKEDILKYFKNNAATIEEYAKQNKLNFNKIEDIITLVNYYNSEF